MANKYVDVSATYNGDGTSSAQAGSAGAAGAWNNLKNVMSGSPGYGSVAAGDIINVRTKNGTNLGEIWSANVTLTTNGTSSSPINMVFDDGTIWANSSGLFTIELTGTYSITWKSYFNVIGKNQNVKLYHSATASGTSSPVENFATALYKDLIVETSTVNSSAYYGIVINGSGYSVFTNCKFNIFRTYWIIFQADQGSVMDFYSCQFSQNVNCVQTYTWFTTNMYYQRFNLSNCVWSNTRNTDYLYNGLNDQGGMSGEIRATNCGMENLILTPQLAYTTTSLNRYQLIISENNSLFNFTQVAACGYVQWKGGQNYPTLSAILPDANSTPWAWKILPGYGAVKAGLPMKCPSFFKYFSQVSGSFTATLEFLANNNYGTPTKNKIWAEIDYTDNTGAAKSVSTFDFSGGNCDASTAAWSSTSYGAKSFSKFKLIASLTNVKQYSDITVTLFVCIPSTLSDNSDFFFVDPELALS